MCGRKLRRLGTVCRLQQAVWTEAERVYWIVGMHLFAARIAVISTLQRVDFKRNAKTQFRERGIFRKQTGKGKLEKGIYN